MLSWKPEKLSIFDTISFKKWSENFQLMRSQNNLNILSYSYLSVSQISITFFKLCSPYLKKEICPFSLPPNTLNFFFFLLFVWGGVRCQQYYKERKITLYIGEWAKLFGLSFVLIFLEKNSQKNLFYFSFLNSHLCFVVME